MKQTKPMLWLGEWVYQSHYTDTNINKCKNSV